VQAGAKPVMAPADMFWGDRYGVPEDPFGHRWAVLTPQRQLSQAELQDAAARFMQQQPEAAARPAHPRPEDHIHEHHL
jgi:hypothetical protein